MSLLFVLNNLHFKEASGCVDLHVFQSFLSKAFIVTFVGTCCGNLNDMQDSHTHLNVATAIFS